MATKTRMKSAEIEGDPSLDVQCKGGSVCVTLGWPKLTQKYNNVTFLVSQDCPLNGEKPEKVAEKCLAGLMKFLTNHRDQVFGELHTYAMKKGQSLEQEFKNADR